MKVGFVLVEVLLASLIASIIALILFSAFYQTNRSVRAVDDFVTIYSKASLLAHQLEKDLSGAFIPLEAKPKAEKKKEKKEEIKGIGGEEVKLLKKVFYGANRNGRLDVLTCITNNPLHVYWGAKTGKPKPRIARVVYRIREDKEEKGTYNLFRQESYTLDFDAFKDEENIRPYELVDRIKDISLEYIVEKPKEEEKKEYKTVKEWDSDRDKEEEKRKERRIPHFVIIKVSFWDSKMERDISFKFSTAIVPEIDEEEEERPEAKKGEQGTIVAKGSTEKKKSLAQLNVEMIKSEKIISKQALLKQKKVLL